ncbi:adenylyl-sulfate kinase [Flavivirga aquimarina]|uniref:Adenylyl-sulfate kinase n=1 Tax=Flavivirga aquimarina TaxID=2027862 RepID=A0ABT8W9I1_9FLAO|nr:adenylyl-sulfate kinase [Flavivirga aquimarina]MDO5969798.1 adenylyl-sulfate kinase [Flavivirga aquimarina]
MNNNLFPSVFTLSKKERILLNGHNSFLVFFTGLSGAGKSTIANSLEERLYKEKIRTYILDGDNVRTGINKDLGFSPEDRSENSRRIGEISKLFIDAGFVVLATFIAPYKSDRERIKQTVNSENFIEVFVNTSLEVCEQRDIKGIYKKARTGEIKNMTGISAPYETPENPDIKVSHLNTIEESVNIIYAKIAEKLKLKI